MGDAIWNDKIKKEIERLHPDFIVINSGGARGPGFEQAAPIIMDEKQTMELIAACGNAK
ncbi:hypothetical protein GJU39_20920 [Pedobacter petrophilus]|uniref:Uncharacterized protein n=1 Tax=Pedobacter petrophilus TaxID=1908241 RepID=A0A7K0G410_9SPHI|nr:hypothetical protein [Pedobacter petrophilus]MRX78545.1 hypothetical protein [Pedobacter petrophilus]